MPSKKREQNSDPAQKKRLDERQLVGLGGIFPGFAEWYRANYDEDGHYIGQRLPGLGTPQASPDLLRLADEARQQIEAGETDERGFGEEIDGA